jgi:hypothetical protein
VAHPKEESDHQNGETTDHGELLPPDCVYSIDEYVGRTRIFLVIDRSAAGRQGACHKRVCNQVAKQTIIRQPLRQEGSVAEAILKENFT